MVSNSVNEKMVYIYIVLMLCMHFQNFLSHVVIFITSIYMVLMMSPCALVGMWCGDEYKDRLVFLICGRFAYTYYYMD